MTSLEITHAEQVGWQRRAASELVALLDAHRDLPVIAWTVGSAGSMLVGHINSLAPAEQVRQVFGTWRAALGLLDHSEVTSGGATYLRAAARRNRVELRLTATTFDEHRQVTR